ncbi:type II secretion system protein E [Candidatus Velamenicoccus archaeovorus]|uniref:Type II secretion system protein E n=1 Tax=Velamenicoccus archaeovorus TaxID=1930593 RepID=A0A410P508_VELA1|nr:GspE/PulE family protein [Candidatus Velamenicoccus archaeovorus]QAT17168.1 type II secretion system protein E [Candidatus Velamenicoccus archaeovorus]
MPRPYLKLGEILVKEGIVTQAQLEEVIKVQAKEGGRLGELLLRLGFATEEDVVVALGKQLGLPYVSMGSGLLKPVTDQNLDLLISKEFAIKNAVLPLSKNLNSLTCALTDPLDVILIDNLSKVTNCEINPVIATKTEILKAIEEFYGKRDILKAAVKESYAMTEEFETSVEFEAEELSIDRLIARAEEAPVVKLVDLIIKQAIDERASDIHIEPFKSKISLRYRIDGVLHEIPPPAKHLQLPIVSRIKILSKLDIAEKRLPQDGGFSVRFEGRTIDLRISVMPTIYGEKIVMRILDKEGVSMDLAAMGFLSSQLELFRRAIRAPYGLIFMTGPTGSGKSTSLYAALSEIKSPTKNIVTVEDPVEYHIEGINQVQIKPEIGLTFASALRSFLRQDPDIMMVGEVRDLETAQICVRSALTGHLVLSTLHTNDAPSAVTRLIDIGVEPYLLMPSLVLIVAQRLVRRLCPDCKEAYEPSQEERERFNFHSDLIYRAKGCDKCNHIGYKKRTCIAEVLYVDDEIREHITSGVNAQQIKKIAISQGMQTLHESGLKKVEEGTTSLEEALSATIGVE